jgi:hypothetical protein
MMLGNVKPLAVETNGHDAAPPLVPAGCPQVPVKAVSTCSEPAVNPQRSDNGMSTGVSGSGGVVREKPGKTGPEPWDPLDDGHWTVFSSS